MARRHKTPCSKAEVRTPTDAAPLVRHLAFGRPDGLDAVRRSEKFRSFGFRPPTCGRWISTARLACLILAFASSLRAQPLSDEALTQIRFDQKIDARISLDLPFRDEAGNPVTLRRYFGKKPVLLVLGYFECPMLCTLVLNGLVESAADMKWSIGKEFDVVDVSICPSETAALASAKKRTYLKRYGRSGAAAGWHFLTADAPAIRQLANEVGFRYAYDPVSKQYAHPSGLVILTPEGKVSRYLFGVTYSPLELYIGLREASSNRIGTAIQQIVLLCFHYNPITGKYSGIVILVLRLMALATLAGFLGLIILLVRRGHKAQAVLAAAQCPPAGSPPTALPRAPSEQTETPSPLRVSP